MDDNVLSRLGRAIVDLSDSDEGRADRRLRQLGGRQTKVRRYADPKVQARYELQQKHRRLGRQKPRAVAGGTMGRERPHR